MEAATIVKYKIICSNCEQEGILVEKESYEVPESSAGGDCGEDFTVYFYEFKIEKGDFSIIHNDVHQYEHEVVCNRCKSINIKRERISGLV